MKQAIGLDGVFRALLLRQSGHADDIGIRGVEALDVRRCPLGPPSFDTRDVQVVRERGVGARRLGRQPFHHLFQHAGRIRI